MRKALGLLLGLFSGLLIYLITAMFFLASGTVPPWFLVGIVVAGTALCSWLILRGTQWPMQVLARGSLIGAVLWLLMIPATMILAAKGASAVAVSGASDAEQTGALIGSGLIAMMGVGLSLAMILICVACHVIARVLLRIMGRKPKHRRRG